VMLSVSSHLDSLLGYTACGGGILYRKNLEYAIAIEKCSEGEFRYDFSFFRRKKCGDGMPYEMILRERHFPLLFSTAVVGCGSSV